MSIRKIINNIPNYLKKIGIGILNNKFFPINPMEHNGYHKAAVLFVIGIILVLIAFTPYKDSVEEIINSPLIPKEISEKEFDERDLQLWINLAAYKRYNERLTTKLKLPDPYYPRIKKAFENVFGESFPIEVNGEKQIVYIDQLFPPINVIEINKIIRKTIGSGIKIITDDEILYEIDLSELKKEEKIKRLNELKSEYWTIASVILKGEREKDVYRIPIDYQTTPKQIYDEKVPEEIRVAYNERKYIPQKIDLERFENDIISKTLDFDERTLIYNLYTYNEKEKYYVLREDLTEEEKEQKAILKSILDRIGFKMILDFNDVFKRRSFPKFDVKKAIVYKNETRILRFKPNSRLYVYDTEIPDFVKKAFILVEDDFFYINIGGVDPPGLVKATLNYIMVGAEKGNASITEQIYEMYLGKKKKQMEDKFVQILFAIYYSYYTQNREDILNFYIQSIPGSFWGDHCYGIKSIAENYLGKTDLKKLTWKELAWITRVGLLPSIHGIEYARFNLMKKAFEEKDYDIFNDDDVDRFLLFPSNIELLRFPGDKVKNASDMKNLILKYRKSYEIATKRINGALEEFKLGNNFVAPLITEEEYQKALKEDINFVKPDFTNLYQVYTDQTRKDMNRIFGKWAWNAGFTVTVALDEAIQTLVDKELEYSTIVAPYFKYFDEDDAPKLGGGAVMIKTHNLKEPEKVENKIIAIASKHPEETYFNWAVDGYRHFGSIYKWFTMLLYLAQEDRGTLLDQYYDIPRQFKIKEDEKKEEELTTEEITSTEEKSETTEQSEEESELKEEIDRRDEHNLYDLDSSLLSNRRNYYYFDPYDYYYDEEQQKEFQNTDYYRPDNWKQDSKEDIFGYYTYKRETNITNFIQSKNVTFVHLSWIVDIQKLADFLNLISGIDPKVDEFRRIYQPYLSLVLGTGESSSIAFAQAASVIPNKGKWKPLSTVEKIVEFDNSEINIKEEPIQIVSREAAEQSLYVGYINTFIGTAKRFITGGIGKTGTSDTDVSFLAMTGRDETQYIEEEPNHILNNNLLYLVNVGVNSGKLPDGLWGGLNGAYNARDVFRTILEWNKKEGSKEAYKYQISGNFSSTFSDKFDYKDITLSHWSGDYKFKIPIPRDKKVHIEKTISENDIDNIRYIYESYAEMKYMNEQYKYLTEGNFDRLNERYFSSDELDYYKNQAQYNNYISFYDQYKYSWMNDPNISYNPITGEFTNRLTGEKVGSSLDYLEREVSGFGNIRDYSYSNSYYNSNDSWLSIFSNESIAFADTKKTTNNEATPDKKTESDNDSDGTTNTSIDGNYDEDEDEDENLNP